MTGLGIDQDEFIKVFVNALGNSTVIQKLQNAVCGQLQTEVAYLRDIIKSKDDRISVLENKVENLENKLDDMEQYSRRNSIRISGIEETSSEDITEKVINLINNDIKVDPPITTNEIDRLHRVGPTRNGSVRPVLVKFATYRTKNKVMRNRRNLKPSSSAISKGKDSVQQKIFVNEDLTKKRVNLLWQARQLKRNGKLQDCWTWDGSVLVKNNVAKIIPVSSCAELHAAAT